jgi:hypothetical protein
MINNDEDELIYKIGYNPDKPDNLNTDTNYCIFNNIFSIDSKKKILKLNKYDFIFRCPCLYDNFSQCSRYILLDKESQNKILSIYYQSIR